MATPSAKIVAGIFAFSFSSLAFTTANVAIAADECLSAPKGAASAGSHWYYRIERGSKRHCWYLADARAKPSKTASQDASSPEDATPSDSDQAKQRAISNARAEMPASTNLSNGQANADQPASATPPASASAPAAAATGNGTGKWIGAERWPNPLSSTPTDSPLDVRIASPSNPVPPPSQQDAAPPATEPAAVAETSVTPANPMHLLSIAIAGALLLAGLISAAIYKFGSWRQNDRSRDAGPRRVNWELPESRRRTPLAHTSDVDTNDRDMVEAPARARRVSTISHAR